MPIKDASSLVNILYDFSFNDKGDQNQPVDECISQSNPLRLAKNLLSAS